MAVKVLYIVSDIDKSLGFEWITERMHGKEFELEFILINKDNSAIEEFLIVRNHRAKRLIPGGLFANMLNFVRLLSLIRRSKASIVHCHLFRACLIGLPAAWVLGVRKRIYTRHHSTYNHRYNKKGVWLDKLFNSLATDIVAISKNVEHVMLCQEKVPEKKITTIHHGFDLTYFDHTDQSMIDALKDKYQITNKYPVIGVIARWIEWKGVQYVIPAFRKLLNEYPEAVLLLANSTGPYRPEIEKLLGDLPGDSYRSIAFEPELAALYKLFDVYIHTPVDPEIEAFGQTYVEALTAGIPSVFSISGIAHELIRDRVNALVVDHRDWHAIYQSVALLLSDYQLRSKLVDRGREAVRSFGIDRLVENLQTLYRRSDR